MASPRAQRYSQFNFLVDLGAGVGDGPQAGFQDFSHVKITGLNKSADVTLKRGVIASSALLDWLNQIRKGHQGAYRTVTITMQNEEHKIVQTWKLLRARIIKHLSGLLNAKGTDVAVEELIISCDWIETS